MLERRQHLKLALPFAQQERRVVHDVAQAQHQRRAPRLEHLSVGSTSPLQAQRLLVDEEQVGPEALRRLPDDRGADRHRLVELDVQAERLVLAVVQLDDARDAHEIDARAEIEAADDRRARQDQDRHALEPIDERVRDRAAAAQVAEAEAVVAVDQDPCVVEAFHGSSVLLGRTFERSSRPCTGGVRFVG